MALNRPTATLDAASKTHLSILAAVPAGTDPVSRWQIAISRDTSLSPSDIYAEVTFNPQVAGNLTPGVIYYYWLRYKNTSGVYSPWSVRYSAYTVDAPPKPTPPIISNITQQSWDITSNPPAGGVVPILTYAYNVWSAPVGSNAYTNMSTHEYSSASRYFHGWTPGYSYAIAVQMRNQSGWSPWSEFVYFDTLAGARVLYRGGWRLAVPYVKYQGSWQVALPYARVGGVWKHSLE